MLYIYIGEQHNSYIYIVTGRYILFNLNIIFLKYRGGVGLYITDNIGDITGEHGFLGNNYI